MAHDMPTEWLAGGTDLMERRRSGRSRGALLRLPEDARLSAITWRADGGATIGAGVTIATIAADARLIAAYPGLTAAAADLATPEIREMATLGGNIAQRTRCWYYRHTQAPCLKTGGSVCSARRGNHLYGVAFDVGPCVAPHASTLATALIAYDAGITTNMRSFASVADILGDGHDGTRDHQLAIGEWIAEIVLPPALANERAKYHRAIGRAAAEWPLVELVTCLSLDGTTIREARFAAGGIAPVPIRLTQAEAALKGVALAALPIQDVQRAALAGAKPLPMTGYKLALLQGLIADALTELGN